MRFNFSEVLYCVFYMKWWWTVPTKFVVDVSQWFNDLELLKQCKAWYEE